jgi:nitrate/TMAO reductase-like tetraheme cytochrome c subunit/mono/diheme cytochrome c family protein
LEGFPAGGFDMRNFLQRVGRFFFPPSNVHWSIRLLPYLLLGFLTFAVLVGSAYAWDYTNSPSFCGTSCHTMPPQFSAYQASPHARIDCVDCHIGKSFIATRITRKAGDLKHVFATIFHDYEYPIRALELRPARETCERCHFPEKFSDDKFKQLVHFRSDANNTPYSIYLSLKTGGGSSRTGLGRGIHWHIENPVYYLTSDPEEQSIPYVKVVDDRGKATEYKATDAQVDLSNIDPGKLKQMDCITCHNRITHLVDQPENTIDRLISRGQISRSIPEIRAKSIEVYSKPYTSFDQGISGIAGLTNYYVQYYSDFYAANQDAVGQAVMALQEAYRGNVYPEQKSDWNAHPNNVGHKSSPGCFRCHDGKHMDANNQAIRLECNLCHSIPKVAGPKDIVVPIEINQGPEPQTHKNANWISMHRDAFNSSCTACHNTKDAGGTSNSSFCSNAACHGSVWTYAGFNAPGLREIVRKQLPPTPTPALRPTATPIPAGGTASNPAAPSGPLTWDGSIGRMLTEQCSNCHGEGGMVNLNLTSYATAMKGGDEGPVIVAGDPGKSLIVQKQSGEQPHYAQLGLNELKSLIDWITAQAPEK